LRTLSGLMMAHKQRLLAGIAAEEERQHREIEAQKRAEQGSSSSSGDAEVTAGSRGSRSTRRET
jgi:hypothetical protein